MKTILEYIQKKRIETADAVLFTIKNINFKDFCKMHTDSKVHLLHTNIKNIVDALNNTSTSSNYNSNITLEFKDGYLHIGAYYDPGNMKIYTAYLFSEKIEFPDKEWANCDWRNAIDINADNETKLWTLVKDISIFSNELIQNKIKK